jgi:hypothetical protein
MIMAFGRGSSFVVVRRYSYKNFVPNGLTTAPGDIHVVTSIDGLDDETHPSPNLALYHGHHERARLATDPPQPALLFIVRGKRELEMLHQGRDDDEHFQDAACSVICVPTR